MIHQSKANRTILWFFVRALTGFLILSLPLWLLLAPFYRTVFASEARALVAIVSKSASALTGEVENLEPPSLSVGRDLKVTIFNHRVGRFTQATVSSYFAGFFPLVTLASLVFATPSPPRRRLVHLLWGFLWINAFIVLRMAALLGLLYLTTRQNDPGAFWEETGQSISTVLNDLPTVSFCAAIIIWISVVFRKGLPPRLSALR